ncbi:MAG: hypothetical protein RIR92_1079 [Pseudomonadota bacterium]
MACDHNMGKPKRQADKLASNKALAAKQVIAANGFDSHHKSAEMGSKNATAARELIKK